MAAKITVIHHGSDRSKLYNLFNFVKVDFETIKEISTQGDIESILPFFEKMINLEDVNIYFRTEELTSIKFLAKCSKITSLNINGLNLKSLNDLAKCEFSHNLKILTAVKCNLGNKDARIENPCLELQCCPNLETLDLSFNPLRSLKGIESCTKLENLRLRYTKVTSNGLNSLQYMTNLESLSIANTSVKNLNVCRFLPNLQVLDCHESGIKDLSPLDNCLTLNTLNFSSCQIKTFPLHPTTNPMLCYLTADNVRLDNLPDFFTDFQYLSSIIVDAPVVERSSDRVRAFMERFYERFIDSDDDWDEDLPRTKVYADSENTHNTAIVKAVRKSIENLMLETLISPTFQVLSFV